MSNQYYSLSDLILDNLFNPRSLLSPYGFAYKLAQKQRKMTSGEFGQAISRMSRRKLLVVTEKNNQKFIKLTKKGQLEVLLQKTKLEKQDAWDGKWRLFMFDIPEDSKHKRDAIRSLLKKHDFCKLQASVYISPYALNRQAIDYLNKSGLRQYIRILKVEEMDSDTELLKKFNLKK
jgi:CRISPR-associated endonuclease Cas2